MSFKQNLIKDLFENIRKAKKKYNGLAQQNFEQLTDELNIDLDEKEIIYEYFDSISKLKKKTIEFLHELIEYTNKGLTVYSAAEYMYIILNKDIAKDEIRFFQFLGFSEFTLGQIKDVLDAYGE